MKTLRSRLVLLGAALLLVLALGSFLLGPGKAQKRSHSFPWAAAAGVAVVGVVAYLARKRATSSGAVEAGLLSCMERLRLQPGKVLHLVEADGRRLLVATSEKGVQLVCELDRQRSAGEEDQP